MKRNDELIEQFGNPTPVLDHGMVRLVDLMGDDQAVVQAARCSYGKGTKASNEDRGLIRYLVRHRHTSPIEMCEIKLHCKMPIVVARQWIRHRTASVNELSGRYSIMPDEMYRPDPGVIARQSTTNKQGRMPGAVDNLSADQFLAVLDEVYGHVRASYDDLIAKGYARELSRITLPLSQYTEWYWKIDLRNLLHFLGLRLDSHAQYEIRVYAEAIANIVRAWCPLVWEAFEDYQLCAVTLSRQEIAALKQICVSRKGVAAGIIDTGLEGRELSEFKTKLDQFGLGDGFNMKGLLS